MFPNLKMSLQRYHIDYFFSSKLIDVQEGAAFTGRSSELISTSGFEISISRVYPSRVGLSSRIISSKAEFYQLSLWGVVLCKHIKMLGQERAHIYISQIRQMQIKPKASCPLGLFVPWLKIYVYHVVDFHPC